MVNRLLVIAIVLLLVVWSNLSVKVSPSSRGGLGVFAQRFYMPGALIERGKFLETRAADVSKRSVLYDYVFQSPTREDSIVLALGNVSLFNHAAYGFLQNAEHVVSPLGFVEIRAKQMIFPGQEILISYGEDYWSSRGIQPSL